MVDQYLQTYPSDINPSIHTLRHKSEHRDHVNVTPVSARDKERAKTVTKEAMSQRKRIRVSAIIPAPHAKHVSTVGGSPIVGEKDQT